MDFTFGIDRRGLTTPLGMDTMSSAFPLAHRYHDWIFSSFSDLLGGRILEVGIGSGIYTAKLLDHGSVVATDLDERCLERVRAEYSSAELECFKLDLENVDDFATLRERPCDVAVCLHVLEHVRDDAAAIRNLAEVLTPGGRLILYVPAMPSIFGTMDVSAGHHRRYRRRALTALVESAGLEVIRARYQNSLCVFAWWVNGRLLKQKDLAADNVARQIRFFDRCIVPVSRFVDHFTNGFMGQSLLVVARKPG